MSSACPPALIIIAVALGRPSLWPVRFDRCCTHIAEELTIKIATAASFASVFAFHLRSWSRCRKPPP